MADETPNPPPTDPSPPLPSPPAAVAKEDPSPPSPLPAVSVSVTESVSSAASETETQTAPPSAAAESVSEPPPPAVAETTKEETPPPEQAPAPAEATVAASEPQPEGAAAPSKSLAAMMEKEESVAADPTVSATTTSGPEEEAATAAAAAAAAVEEKKIPQNLGSFKEESNRVGDLSDAERKALEELKQLVQEAIDTSLFPSDKPETKQVSIWGIPLLEDERSDVILLKFLRARDFKVKESLAMIKNTLQWRKEFGIDELLDEDLGDEMEKVVFMHGQDKEGHPVCYNVYGEFQNKELYQKAFSDEERRMKFLRWRIQFLEKSIRKLDFSPGGVSTIFQVSDLKNSPGPGKRELRLATKQALQLLQDNYPEFVAKQVFINVPWWYLAFYTMISPFMTQRTKSKFVFAGPAKSADTLFKYIPPEQVPIQYGGLSVDYCDCNPDFSDADPATELTVKPGTKQTVEITNYEKCILVWEIRVVGWEVSYGAEFAPNAKDSYTVIIQKPTKMSPKDEPVVTQSFKVGELGKVLLTVDNPTSKKKKLIYRFKVKPYSD